MIFYNKLAKLGKGQTASCVQTDNGVFNVYLSDGNTTLKNLQEDNKVYNLSQAIKLYNYHQIVGLTQGYLLARIDELVSIIKENDGD